MNSVAGSQPSYYHIVSGLKARRAQWWTLNVLMSIKMHSTTENDASYLIHDRRLAAPAGVRPERGSHDRGLLRGR